MRENWNFKNDIGIPMEIKARGVFGIKGRRMMTVFDSDYIGWGYFYIVAQTLFFMIVDKTTEEIEDWLEKYKYLEFVSYNEDNKKDFYNAYNDFEKVYKHLKENI